MIEPRSLTFTFTTAPTTESVDAIALAVYRAVGSLGVVIAERRITIEKVVDR